VIQLPAFALERIRTHRQSSLSGERSSGARWRDPLDDEGVQVTLVCERGDGSFIHPDSFTHAFKRFGSKARLHPSTRLHDVRHAVATELGRQGVHGVIVSAVLGHASNCIHHRGLLARVARRTVRGRRCAGEGVRFRPLWRWQSVGK
jgi:hypothetical protein